MAIQFLNSLDLNKNQLLSAVTENLTSDPSGANSAEGMLYFNTSTDKLRVYANGAWVNVGDQGSSGVDTFTNANGTYVSFSTVNSSATGNVTVGTVDLSAVDGTASASTRFLTKTNKWAVVPDLYSKWQYKANGGTAIDMVSEEVLNFVSSSGIGLAAAAATPNTLTISNTGVLSVTTTDSTFINLTPNSATTGAVNVTATLSASGTPANNNYLRGDNSWATLPASDNYQYWQLEGDDGNTPKQIGSTDKVDVAGGTYITTAVSGNDPNYAVQISHDNTSRSDTTSSTSPSAGATFTAVDGVSTNATGHVTAINVKTVTMPAEVYTGTVTEVDGGTGIVTNPSSGITTTGSVSLKYDDTDNYILATSSSATAASGDTIAFSDVNGSNNVKKTTFGNIPMVALTAVKTYIDNAVAGGLVFQGGYNAQNNNPVLDSRGTQIAVSKGDTYAVTDAGTFYGETVEAGDLLIAQDDISAGNGSLSDWVVVQSNIGAAGSGSTDGATTKGYAGFDSTDFSVTANGWVQLVKPPASTTKKISLNSSVTGVSVNGAGTVYTIDLSAAWAAGIEAENVTCEIRGTSAAPTPYATVYADVAGTSTADELTITFAVAPTAGHYNVLLTNVE